MSGWRLGRVVLVVATVLAGAGDSSVARSPAPVEPVCTVAGHSTARPGTPARLVWSTPFGRSIAFMYTKVDDETVFAVAYPLTLAIDAESGRTRWTSPAAVDDVDHRRGVAYLQGLDTPGLSAVDVRTGIPRWSFTTDDHDWFVSMVDHDDDVIVIDDGDTDRTAFMDSRTGTLSESIWHGAPDRVLSAEDGYAIATYGRTVKAFSVSGRFKGQQAWERRIPADEASSLHDGTAILEREQTRGRTELTRLELRTGRPLWRRALGPHPLPTEETLPAPETDRFTIIVGDILHRLRTDDGRVTWSIDLSANHADGSLDTPSFTFLPDRYLLVALDDHLLCIDGATGTTVWNVTYPGEILRLSTAGPRACITVRAATGSETIYGVDTATGQPSWTYYPTGPEVDSLDCLGDGAVFVSLGDVQRVRP